ncbi:MAG: MarR family transcriptional regulator [Anaerovibrio sp.]|uniref:MarR family winged helix-turn-helix transcriptional regulator n=1 Tax=Anaerovibrio sp. TaxID=1872532 RepID=UPI0025F50FAD|nr:MarR family transcriptional regulator [Anaerovibrio sp.]MCR5175500.1 MarR family transcriptional regulator [Anaerovibrio sp.]
MSNERLGKYISILYRQSQIYFNAELKKFKLGSGQYIFLLGLLKNDGINQEQLADYVKIDKATTARAVAKLEREGYLIREICPTDKRAYILHPTDKAKKISENLDKILDHWNDTLLAGFSAKEKDILQKFLARIRNNIFA